LESFARFGTRLDEETRKTLERGRRVREILKQPQYQPLPVAEQVAILFAVNGGVFDDVSLSDSAAAEQAVRQAMRDRLPDVSQRIEAGEQLSQSEHDSIGRVAREAKGSTGEAKGSTGEAK
jgi:F-type H+-transporting ATPase subunit alpha